MSSSYLILNLLGLIISRKDRGSLFLNYFIVKLRLLTHVVDHFFHKGIARRALPASGGKDAVWGIK